MRLIRTAALTAATVLLAACASGSLPLPHRLPENTAAAPWYQLTQYDAAGAPVRATLLTVAAENGGLRFVQTDPLGAPVSRQRLHLPQGWKNDGFIPPNAAARRVFAAVLPLMSADPAAVYPQLDYQADEHGGRFSQGRQELWRWQNKDNGHRLTFPDGSQWQLSPLQD
ncbi:hypothetical protein L1281_001333 [Neisseria sp. HSC-16F19]|nr:hypothetical protein [Neisseria sp. HSC-16F19]MCP2040744.1 hypothetical protein [Neisseria sp. HSC-16F19]